MNKPDAKQSAYPEHLLLGEILLQKQKVKEKHINYALEIQKTTKDKIGQILVQTGLITETDLARALAEQLGLKYINLKNIVPDQSLTQQFTQERCLFLLMLPIKKDRNSIYVVTSELPDKRLETILQRKTGLRPFFLITEKSDLVSAIYKYFNLQEHSFKQILAHKTNVLKNDAEQNSNLEDLIHSLLLAAVKNRATDIHIRPMPEHLDISLRIDGLLTHYMTLTKSLARVVTAIKLKASMDISEQRLPQDGRFTLSVLAEEYDIRASSLVTSFGEDLVLRILPKAKADFSLNSLGFFNNDVKLIKRIFAEPSGIILISGPTGAGKSTTLTAGLISMDLLEKNVLSIEDPIEYLVPLARQTQTASDIGYDFHNAMNFFLRHDPDVIMIGELREPKTASTAMAAALTGHLVFSTLHSDTVLSSLTRLKNLGINFPSIAEGLIALISQRLVRCICPECKIEYFPSPDDIDYLEQNAKKLFKGTGCENCNYTGYFGRTLIYGILPIEKELSLLLKENASAQEIENKAREKRQRNMFEVGVKKILHGVTTVEELQRVLGRYRYL